MAAPAWHLAQINIARARGPMDGPVMAEFVAALDGINVLAEASPGFVWRLKDESGNATALRAFPDPLMLVNMSVWADVASLQLYVYRTMHGRFFARRQEWFEKLEHAYVALWWIPVGHEPTTDEAKQRLDLLERSGPSAAAFTFRQIFPPPTPAATQP